MSEYERGDTVWFVDQDYDYLNSTEVVSFGWVKNIDEDEDETYYTVERYLRHRGKFVMRERILRDDEVFDNQDACIAAVMKDKERVLRRDSKSFQKEITDFIPKRTEEP